MPRQATFALALCVVLFSAGSVGSQDPFRARSEAESAASAMPISAIGDAPQAVSDPFGTGDAPAIQAPLSLAPHETSGFEQPVIAPLAPQPAPSAEAPAPQRDPAPKSETNPTPVESITNPIASDDSGPLTTLAQSRLFATVPDDIENYFDLFMYVSKSNRGPLAQHMFVFQRDTDGKIIPYAEWKVSTGREKIELHLERKVRTNTPEGIFQLDPDRMHAKYWSRSWGNAPMHYAMFYDLLNNGNQSGLAIHAAIGQAKIKRLGRRDSAGCIRLSPKNAKELFYKVRNTLKGQVPVLAMNERGSTDRWGRPQRDTSGSILLQDGYRAVLFVENYDGRQEISGPVVAYTN